MGSSHGKHKHQNGSTRPLSGASIYALCAGQPSKVVYSRSMEHCSLKLYRAETHEETDDQMVVLLDCGGKVYANGRRVYPFVENGVNGMGGNGHRYHGTYKVNGSLDKHVEPGDTTATLDTLLALVSDTFDQMLKDGLRLQDAMRQLEEENTTLSLKVLELQKEQLQVQRLELEKKKLELRIEELEAKTSLFAGVMPQRKISSLVRTGSLNGRSDNGPGTARRTESLVRKFESSSSYTPPSSYTPTFISSRSPNLSPESRRKDCLKKVSAVTHILELESKRKELNKETAELQFQFDTLSKDHEKIQNGRVSPVPPTHVSGSPPRSITSMFREKNPPLSPRLHQSLERLNMEIDPKPHANGETDAKWERYDTLRRKYEELKQRRSQRLSRHGSTDDIVLHREVSSKRLDRGIPIMNGSGGRLCGSRDGSVSGDSDTCSSKSSGSEFETKTNGVINGHHNTIVITKMD